jgi:hypothetical protein
MGTVSDTLRVFCGDEETDEEVNSEILTSLGEPTEERKWLAASLGKTIRLQLDPPDELRGISALEGPDWIRQ